MTPSKSDLLRALRHLDRILSTELSAHNDPHLAIGAAQFWVSDVLGETSGCAKRIAERDAEMAQWDADRRVREVTA